MIEDTADHQREGIVSVPERAQATFIGEGTVATNYAEDVAKYTDSCDEACVKGIVRHCGIALQSRDASMVSCSDEAERARVRDSFLKKKLGRSEPDADLDAAVSEICERMKDTRQKSRVTFYYLLAEKYGQLDLFRTSAS